MWLALEKGTARGLHLRQDVAVGLLNPHPEQDTRDALVLHAAHSVFPEAAVESLPGIARAELAAGLTGPLRHAIADARQDTVVELRDHLVEHLSGQVGATAAVTVADRVHLSRLVRGDVPAIVAAGCLAWYGLYRSAGDPHASLVAALLHLEQEWLHQPADRARLEQAMKDAAASLVGHHPDDLLDVPV